MAGLTVTIKGGGGTMLAAGENVTVTGVGTAEDPYVISAQLEGVDQEQVPLVLVDPAESVIPTVVVRNPDGSVTLEGAFQIPGPVLPGDPITVATLPVGYLPRVTGAYTTAADHTTDADHYPVAVRMVLVDDGLLAVVGPAVPEGAWLTVFLYSVTYWPVVQ